MSLGIYYGLKAELLGGRANPQSRPWYEKSVAVSERARRISEAAAKNFDEAQTAHGRPPAGRLGSPLLYFNLANGYLNLGQPERALETLRYGQGIDPTFALFLNAIRGIYSGIPDAGCAAGPALDANCGRVKADMCEAAGNLARAFVQARNPARGSAVLESARQTYGCP